MTTSDPVLVTGATGKQGGAVARALLAEGTPVRALVRDPRSERASAIEALGATLLPGDLNDRESLVAAVTGARAVFSIQTPDLADFGSDSEMRQGKSLVEAATAAGVPQFVHTSVSGAGDAHRNAPGWKEGRWNRHYWESKAYTQELVRDAGFTYWTVLKPGFFMENFIRPSFLFANFAEDRLLTAIAPDTELSLIAVRDIGTAAAAAIKDPETFHKVELELAGDRLTLREVAAILSEALGTEIAAPSLSPEEALAQGLRAEFVSSQERLNEVGSPAMPEYAHRLGLTTTDFRSWAAENLRPSE
jgi:uncharacterized protein YbjT (DUF2867 family)